MFCSDLRTPNCLQKESLVLSGTAESYQHAARRNALLFVIVFFAGCIVRVLIFKYVDQSIESKLLAAASSLLWKTLVWIWLACFLSCSCGEEESTGVPQTKHL
jgi:hypothetical protein